MVTKLTPEELLAIEARHVCLELVAVCNFCHQFWPCDAARLVGEVKRLRGVAEAAKRLVVARDLDTWAILGVLVHSDAVALRSALATLEGEE